METWIVCRRLIGMALFLALVIGHAPSDLSRLACHCTKPERCQMPASRGNCCELKPAPATAILPASRVGAERPESIGLPVTPEPWPLASFETRSRAARVGFAPAGAIRPHSPLRV